MLFLEKIRVGSGETEVLNDKLSAKVKNFQFLIKISIKWSKKSTPPQPRFLNFRLGLL